MPKRTVATELQAVNRIPSRVMGRLKRLAKRFVRSGSARRLAICEGAGNCLFLERFSPESVIIDVGCADDADFSCLIMGRYGSKCFGVDPTRKHASALAALAEKKRGLFVPVPLAIGAAVGQVEFHESVANVSGSLNARHANILGDCSITYSVEAVDLDELLTRLALERADFIKLDLEGAEYELLESISRSTLMKFKQVFIEFHHHCVSNRSIADTQNCVRKLESFGLQTFSYDDHNVLFFWDVC